MKLNFALLAIHATTIANLAGAQSTGAQQLCTANPTQNVRLGNLNNADNTPSFLLNGKPWMPKGLQIRGFVSSLATAKGSHTHSTIAAQKVYGQRELDAAVDRFGADMLRFQVSQADLDPKYKDPKEEGLSKKAKAKYLSTVYNAIKLARQNCFVVIISMQAEKHSGYRNRSPLPNSSTKRAWATLLDPSTNNGAALAADKGIMLEIYNEPGGQANNSAWQRWAHASEGKKSTTEDGEKVFGMQPMINFFRQSASKKGLNSQNVLMVDGLEVANTFEGVDSISSPLVDPIGSPYQIAYAVHPYFHLVTKHKKKKGKYDFAARWGFLHNKGANGRPPAVVLSTEWSAEEGKTKGLGLGNPPNTREVVDLLNFMIQNNIPMSAGAFDIPQIMVQSIPFPNGTVPPRGAWVPTNYDHYSQNHCEDSGNNAGLFIKRMFESNYGKLLKEHDGVTRNMGTPLWCTTSSAASSPTSTA